MSAVFATAGLVALGLGLGLVLGALLSAWRRTRAASRPPSEEHEEFVRQMGRAERLNVEVTVSDERAELLRARGRLWQVRQDRLEGKNGG